MANKAITLYDGGQQVASYADAEIVQFPQNGYPLTFKIKEKKLSVKGKEHDLIITRTLTTTLKAIIEETIEHSGLITI
jgi:hypothetical protein